MSTHNIGFNEEMRKIIFQLSSNMHLICSSGGHLCTHNTLTGDQKQTMFCIPK